MPQPVLESPASEPEEVAPCGAQIFFEGKPVDRVPLRAEMCFGRDPQADVVLGDPAVSRRHATVRFDPQGGCVVTDLHSTAGSFVNGHRFDTQELTVGDRLQIGPFTFLYDGQALVRTSAACGDIAAREITASIGTLTILKSLSFSVPPAQFAGIIGPSGAGKSTLLHTLAGLRAPESGTVQIAGRDVYDAGPADRSFGFVPQEDIVHPELTVAQALHFAARLRLPASTPAVELYKLSLQTMDQLGLRERAGHTIARLSGGQRKRVSVAVELLARPAVLFLDEPSSGLDPATEFQLMELLRDLADTGCTILCTTHVMDHAFLMDQLLVLAAGHLVFQGTAQEARQHFAVAKLPALYDRLQERPAREWREAWTAAARSPESLAPARPAAAPAVGARFPVPILLHRQWTILAADPRNFLFLLGQPLLIGALISWVSDKGSLLLFFAYVATLWFGCSNAAQEIVREIAIYRRERLVGVGTHAYLLAKTGFLGAITILQSVVLYLAILLGEWGTDGSPAWHLAGLVGTALAAVGIGLAISAWARSTMQAVLVVPLVLIPQILFCGFTVPASEMTPAVRAVSRPMPSYAAQTLMDTAFLWGKVMDRTAMTDYMPAYRNLMGDTALTSRDRYLETHSAAVALATQAGWVVVSYLAAWAALRRRERQ